MTISRLRHQGVPGLQAQKCSSTVKTAASARVMGTTFAMVSPSIRATCMGRLDIVASLPDCWSSYAYSAKFKGG
ncbi:hypothetical protein [Bradyrhizobium diazoefficiens]